MTDDKHIEQIAARTFRQLDADARRRPGYWLERAALAIEQLKAEAAALTPREEPSGIQAVAQQLQRDAKDWPELRKRRSEQWSPREEPTFGPQSSPLDCRKCGLRHDPRWPCEPGAGHECRCDSCMAFEPVVFDDCPGCGKKHSDSIHTQPVAAKGGDATSAQIPTRESQSVDVAPVPADRGAGAHPPTADELPPLPLSYWTATGMHRGGQNGPWCKHADVLAREAVWQQRVDEATGAYLDIVRKAQRAEAECDRLRAEVGAIADALGTSRFMDPPDGGDVSLAEQVKRMRAEVGALIEGNAKALALQVAQHKFDADHLRAEVERLKATVAEVNAIRLRESQASGTLLVAADRRAEAAEVELREAEEKAQQRLDDINEHLRMMREAQGAEPVACGGPLTTRPVDVVLYCPKCGTKHVDRPEPANGWDNPPHKSHLCHECGAVWRPSNIETNGVEDIFRCGTRDTILAMPYRIGRADCITRADHEAALAKAVEGERERCVQACEGQRACVVGVERNSAVNACIAAIGSGK